MAATPYGTACSQLDGKKERPPPYLHSLHASGNAAAPRNGHNLYKRSKEAYSRYWLDATVELDHEQILHQLREEPFLISVPSNAFNETRPILTAGSRQQAREKMKNMKVAVVTTNVRRWRDRSLQTQKTSTYAYAPAVSPAQTQGTAPAA
ncbi:hypothetical protein CLAFUW4_04274 [Fulvia fulva]|uniref:Uncharacterized protein n=1 Tax=Passalora fulva TaxID=5499 RepID=A0A9Q8LFQ2_PASFU|nr:uncharacterized protein CLAFUR5_04239 [Fulvia fulva]KAK4626857.1 hypothetical protein CLAFUR4_04260 [Fulvia fulva]KAK4628318.1 hypothetical protein CLAFUR0_04262 [Fulvia fulva]UJO15803.1 hypothetical protein CLAFUR5_04239 [Fulvia fulva]WPV14032.1 hypothetical protein CLAFUW4_04274 [Fulvia fulva]WPV28998.1 hypothetical protein CLAFUW7_04263 [Fulvia fulva]